MYNFKVATVSGISAATLHVFAHMQFNNWTVNQGVESNVTWLIGVSAFVAMFAMLQAKDNYHN